MGGYAWVTLATNDSYSLGALVLAHSLKQAGTVQQLAVLVTPGVTNAMREKLSSVFNLVQEVNILDSKDETNLRLLKRPELGVTFTKLHCWRLTQFDKCVFLDADTLVLRNCDELFEREELSAAPDVGWPDCFNSGVFVYRPSDETFEKLVQFALEKGSFDGGDQGLLNLFFSDWAHKDISKHLPFIYNMCSTACYSYLPAFKQFGGDAKIIHFIGSAKPWLQYFNTETREVQPAEGLHHLKDVLQNWWNIFCNLIYPSLTADMARPNSDTRQANPPRISRQVPPTLSSIAIIHPQVPQENYDFKNVWDPWENYHESIPSPALTASDEFFEPKPIESHNTNACSFASDHHHVIDPVPLLTTSHDRIPSPEPQPQPFSPPVPPICNVTNDPTPQTHTNNSPPQYHSPPAQSSNVDRNPRPQSPVPLTVPETNLNQQASPMPALPIEYEATTTVSKNCTLHECSINEAFENRDQTGIAGAFAQLTLGAPRTAEQTALDDHLRKQGWEVGNIDYLGKDSFDNIWSKISATLSASLLSAQEPALASPSPPPQTPSAPAPSAPAKPKEPTPPPSQAKAVEQAVVAATEPEAVVPPADLAAPQTVPVTQTVVPQTPPISQPAAAPEPTPALPPLTPLSASPAVQPAAPPLTTPAVQPAAPPLTTPAVQPVVPPLTPPAPQAVEPVVPVCHLPTTPSAVAAELPVKPETQQPPPSEPESTEPVRASPTPKTGSIVFSVPSDAPASTAAPEPPQCPYPVADKQIPEPQPATPPVVAVAPKVEPSAVPEPPESQKTQAPKPQPPKTAEAPQCPIKPREVAKPVPAEQPKPVPTDQPKPAAATAAKPEVEPQPATQAQATSGAAGPTPPPRKGSGGPKKTKSKK